MKQFEHRNDTIKISCKFKEYAGADDIDTVIEVAASKVDGDFSTGFIILDSFDELLTLRTAINNFTEILNIKTDIDMKKQEPSQQRLMADVLVQCLGSMMQPEADGQFSKRQVLTTEMIARALAPMIEVEINTLASTMQRLQYAIEPGVNGPGWLVFTPPCN